MLKRTKIIKFQLDIQVGQSEPGVLFYIYPLCTYLSGCSDNSGSENKQTGH